MKILAPSILSADFLNLDKQIKILIENKIELLHCDIMDGHFVPNLTFGPLIVDVFKKNCNIPLDVHLMVKEPEKFIRMFLPINPEYLTIHYEAEVHLNRQLNFIKENGIKAGVSINPATPIEQLSEVLEIADLVLIMSVNPGFGGQKFIQNCLRKIVKLNEIRSKYNLNFLIEVDGGLNRNTIGDVSVAGCDIFVAGSSLFGAKNITSEISLLRDLIKGKNG